MLRPSPQLLDPMADAPGGHVLENARLVLADRVIDCGWVAFAGSVIAEIGEGRAPERGEDMDGDFVIPGLVELHTDHIEAHYVPRPKVNWDPVAAVMSYDGQIAACGITTVLDSLRVWREDEAAEDVDGDAAILADAIATATADGLLRADHYIHLRCEVPMPDVVAEARSLIGRAGVRLLSLMDHTPGQRQFRDEGKLRTYYRGKKGGMTDDELDRLFAKRTDFQRKYADGNYRGLIALARQHGTPLASHDDTTLEHVGLAMRDNVSVAEFPTTVEAARALHAAGIRVMMGAPNLVRGGSHAGNIATADLARIGCLDILSSDYVPSSLLMAAFQMPRDISGLDLATAVRTVSKTPAETLGFSDRGEIAAGKRADLVRVRVVRNLPVARATWRTGRRVA